MVTFLFCRHGETDLNSEKKLRSWIDVPLNRLGIKDAEHMADELKKTMFDKIYASDLKRSVKTAEIIADSHRLKVIENEAFRPLNYGTLNGKLLTDIQDKLDELTEEWKTNPDAKAPKGESFTEFQDRNLTALKKILNQPEVESILLVGHLRNSLLFHEFALIGKPLEGESVQVMDGKKWAQEEGSIAEYEWEDNKLTFVGMIGDKKATTGAAAS
jgi:broad specificity phosphatase PhoE